MSDKVPTADVGLALILTSRRAWVGAVSASSLAYLVPSEKYPGFWHVAVADVAGQFVDCTDRPVSTPGVNATLRHLGADPAGIDWREADEFAACDPNPFAA